MSALFSPLQIKNMTLRNRVVVSPMCQYSATDGTGDDWLIAHLGSYAVSGPGLVLTEATHVSAVGRITPKCLGLYSDDNEKILARVVKFFRERGGAPIGVQLAHAGRKASTSPPWDGGKPVPADQGGWQTVGPSAIGFGDWPAPTALDEAGLKTVKQQFVDSTKRAARIGFDCIELHGAHGYLMSEFLSPLANTRTDGYGGSLEKRMRYPLEIFEAVRGVWPADKALGIRISATEYADGGWSLDDAATFVTECQKLGCDFVDVSGGGVVAHQKIDLKPGYQVAFAEHIKRKTGMTTMAVGLITEPAQAEQIVTSGQADLVALARAFLRNPRWVWDAADELGVDAGSAPFVPNQYLRGRTPGLPRITPAR